MRLGKGVPSRFVGAVFVGPVRGEVRRLRLEAPCGPVVRIASPACSSPGSCQCFMSAKKFQVPGCHLIELVQVDLSAKLSAWITSARGGSCLFLGRLRFEGSYPFVRLLEPRAHFPGVVQEVVGDGDVASHDASILNDRAALVSGEEIIG